MAASIVVHLEFGGGAELLFGGVRNHQVTLPSQSQPWTVKQLLVWIRANLLKERPELFLQGDTVTGKNKDVCMIQLKDINVHLRSMFHIARPGILVLINDADWELMGELSYLLQDQDNVIFISTLHGG